MKSNPLDIVLLLDVSGSMNERLSGNATTYEEVYANDLNQEETYWVNTWGRYREVWYPRHSKPLIDIRIDGYWDRENLEWVYGHYEYTTVQHPAGWYYGNRNNPTSVTPKTSADDRENTQFYTRHVTQAMDKIDALKNAVNNFIDQAALANQGVSEHDQHRISIVKFAGWDQEATEMSSNKIGNNGEYHEYSNGWQYDNYNQVGKRLHF